MMMLVLSLVLLCLLLMLVWLWLVCLAQGITSSPYVPSEQIKAFSFYEQDFSFDMTTTSEPSTLFNYNARNNNATSTLPAVIFALNSSDPFSVYTASRTPFLDDFLTQTPTPDVQYLFLQYQPRGVDVLAHNLAKRMQALNLTQQQIHDWKQRLHFANETINELLQRSGDFAVLPNVLSSLGSFARQLTFSTPGGNFSVPRLDGHFQYCNVIGYINHSPTDPTKSWPATPGKLTYGGNSPCSTGQKNYTGQYTLIYLPESAGCSAEEAAKIAIDAGAIGVVVMVGPDQPLRQMGEESFEDQGLWSGNDDEGFCSMVTYDKTLLEAVQGGGISTITYIEQAVPGYFASIDVRGRIQELGEPINPTMMLLGWQAQGLEYKAALYHNLTKPALVVPIMDVVGPHYTGVVQLPAAHVLDSFESLYIHSKLSCTGLTDLDCDVWDHIISVNADCVDPSGITESDVQPKEIGRWVTPYRRRVGEWLIDATLLRPMLQGNCTFRMAGTDNGSPWVFSLALRFMTTNSPHLHEQSLEPPLTATYQPFAILDLFNTTENGNFDRNYNNRTTITFSIPSATKQVFVQAIITGHGDMEFTASRHSFIFQDGQSYNFTFLEPLDQMGCAKRVREGVEPNGHGAWWFGRDGWCNGFGLANLNHDVTSSVLSGSQEGTVLYQAYQYVNGSWELPQSSGGYMRVSSHLVFLSSLLFELSRSEHAILERLSRRQ
eukprot:m.200407 g.200407  ORF g.200407 m.200407 type:complete len:718 (-) comp25942_c1_seq5:1928-4081(-)